MKILERIPCWFGLHIWNRGRGWIELGGGNSMHHNGYKCEVCGKLKSLPAAPKADGNGGA